MIVDFYETKTEQRVFDDDKYYWFDENNHEDMFYAKIADDIY